MEHKIKVLIGDNTPEYGVKVASKLRDMGIYAYTRRKEGKKIFDSIANDSPDVVVTDLSMPDFDAVALMDMTLKKLVNKPIFIVVSDVGSSYIERHVIEAGASYFITMPYEVETLSTIIKSVFRKPKVSEYTRIEVLVTNTIQKLSVPAHIKGYHYLRTAIISVIEDQRLLDSVTKLLYPLVASQYDTIPSRVERAIRNAIEIAWERGDEKVFNDFFGYTQKSYRGRPTNSEFIALVADKLRLMSKQSDYSMF